VKFASGLIAYTEAERQADAVAKHNRVKTAINRRNAAPKGNYSRQGSPETRARDLRILGEQDLDTPPTNRVIS
jgi:hypothetical protein